MSRMVAVAAIGAALGVAGIAQAQDVYYWPASGSTAVAAPTTEFPLGTPLQLITRTEVNTKQARPGDRVYLDVAENLTYRGQIVVPAGAPAVAEVVRSERNGHFGKRGTVEVRLLHVQTPYGPVRLSGDTSDQGTSAHLLSIGGALVIAWPMVFIHGTSGYIRGGTAVTAHLAEPLRFAAAAYLAGPEVARPLPASFAPGAFGGQIPARYRR